MGPEVLGEDCPYHGFVDRIAAVLTKTVNNTLCKVKDETSKHSNDSELDSLPDLHHSLLQTLSLIES